MRGHAVLARKRAEAQARQKIYDKTPLDVKILACELRRGNSVKELRRLRK